MNLNILAYCIYGIITIYTTIFVGKQFHTNGYYYISSIFKEEQITNAINNLLLIGYYLLNIGFAIIKINFWSDVLNHSMLIESVSNHIAQIFILLGLMNIINISVLSIFRKIKSVNY